MKKYIKVVLIVCMMFLLTGCSSAPLSVEELKENEDVISYFAQRNVSITDIELEKRQTNKENKEDIAYVKIKAENEFAILEGTYIIESSYFDEGGWNVMGIGCNKGGTYKPKDKVVYDVSGEYFNATSVEYTNYEIIQQDDSKNEYRSNLFYEVYYDGELASITEKYSVELVFDIYEGEWIANAESNLIDSEYELFIKDGNYQFKNTYLTHPHLFKLEFTNVNARLTYYEWDEQLSFDEQKGYIGGYREYYLGMSYYYVEDGGIFLEEFGDIYGNKHCFKIEPNKIFHDRDSIYLSRNLTYDTELERVE